MAGTPNGPAPEPSAYRAPGADVAWDEALTRLEDTLLSYSYDRVLPDLATILQQAGVTEEFVRSDERAAKVLHEAIMARPLSSADTVRQLKTEVELLTLEVEVLTERLRDPAATAEEGGRAAERLREVRRRLEELQHDL